MGDSSDYTDGIEGAANDYRRGVQRDSSQTEYEESATEDNATDWENNASSSGSDYANGVANYLDMDEEDIRSGVASDYTAGIDGEAADDWQDGVSESGQKWQEEASQSADEYEEEASESGEEWLEGYADYYQPEE